jgi:hypothetical protein
MQFVEAVREHSFARIALVGISGSGKTLSSLKIAKGLGGKRIGVIDSERGSARKHSGKGIPFQVLELSSFAPATYVEAMAAAYRAGIDVLIVDGLSQAWAGKDGALEMVDQVTKRSRSQNSFAAWREVTPEHTRMVDALVSIPCHVIVTMRAKSDWVVEDVDNGKGGTSKAPKRLGMAPIQREGLEYEFDIVGDMTGDHDWVISKTRCERFDRAIIRCPGEEFGAQLLDWLNEGTARIEAPPAQPAAAQPAAPAPAPREVAPPPAVAPPAAKPTFSTRADWSGSPTWAGKPLDSAPAAALEAYRKALDLAIANPKNKSRIRALTEHIAQVSREWMAARAREQAEAAAAAAADPFADMLQGGGWHLNGSGEDDDMPVTRSTNGLGH